RRSTAIIRSTHRPTSCRRCVVSSTNRGSGRSSVLRSRLEASMKRVLLSLGAVAIVASAWQTAAKSPDANEIISMERAAIDRGGHGDPRGYLEIYAPDATYFDPTQEARLDGLDSLTRMLGPWTGKIRIDRYELRNPKVQWHGDAAILTFNLVN